MAEITVRPLVESDLQKGFFECLSNLTTVGKIRDDMARAKKIFQEIKNNPTYNIIVALKDDQVVGLITLLVEQKFIHDGGKVGHIEDVVTRKGFEGMGVGSALVNEVLNLARKTGCYKVILDCSEKNVQFYEKLKFKKHEISMRYDI